MLCYGMKKMRRHECRVGFCCTSHLFSEVGNLFGLVLGHFVLFPFLGTREMLPGAYVRLSGCRPLPPDCQRTSHFPCPTIPNFLVVVVY
jgi:hypothetical protein